MDEIKAVVRIAGELARDLEGALPSPEAISSCLKSYFPTSSGEELLRWCTRLYEGVADGTAQLGDLSRLTEQEREDWLLWSVRRQVKDMELGQQRRFYLLLLQILYGDSGWEIASGTAVRYANLSLGELESRVCALVQLKGEEIAGQSMELLERDLPGAKPGKMPERDYSGRDRSHIHAAAFFAVMHQEMEAERSFFLGQQYGYEAALLEQVQKAVQEKKLSEVLHMLHLGSLLAGIRFALAEPMRERGKPELLRYMKQGCLRDGAAHMLAAVAGVEAKDDSAWLLKGPFARYAKENGSSARMRLDRYFAGEQEIVSQSEMNLSEEPDIIESRNELEGRKNEFRESYDLEYQSDHCEGN